MFEHKAINVLMVSGVIITYNESKHIQACIESMKNVADEIIVVDSFSTDNTKEICLSLGVKFIENKFEGHIEQKNFAVSQASYQYVLSLDADERVSDKMAEAILKEKGNWSSKAYSFNRLNNYCGKWLKWSWYPDRKVRLWDKSVGKWGGENPHDKVVLNDGEKAKILKVELLHFAYDTIDQHMIQIQQFAKIAATNKLNKGFKPNFLFHICLSPFYSFVKRYFFKLAILDGYYGFIYCIMASYLGFLKYSYAWELHKKSNKIVT